MPLLLLAFIVVPIIELAVIGQVRDVLGWPLTLLLLFADSLVGAILVRREGRRAWLAFREALGNGRWPGDEVMQGALVLVGGALLVTPGFVTDVVGLAAVVPASRALLSRTLRGRFTPAPVRIFQQAGRPSGAGSRGPADAGARREPGRDQERDGPRSERPPGVMDVEVVSIERDERGAGSERRTDRGGDPGDQR